MERGKFADVDSVIGKLPSWYYEPKSSRFLASGARRRLQVFRRIRPRRHGVEQASVFLAQSSACKCWSFAHKVENAAETPLPLLPLGGINILNSVMRRNILKLDESPSQIRNPKPQNGLYVSAAVAGPICDFGFEMGFRPISILVLPEAILSQVCYCPPGRGCPKDASRLPLPGGEGIRGNTPPCFKKATESKLRLCLLDEQ